ncbi:hypothetical protein SA22_2286 [Salmonella enterica subsp. enterica serovar Agona str. 22.H.04]|uniref:Uncharacterized protein n=1 Tax=Salmonella agona (strain SL483) TaxID=454166 RepID=B5F1K0_SALA4|nr:hypothetical protein SeAg_B4438 [Salmonella enterica subsp. enterica serovar Agona str. SL483]CCR01862.1 hypothetical protein SA73_3093 [Salmonella enterica subsp. enterica serovar Agona str. 73.H.09]CCR04180.1 hypothetical protein SA72_0729 [Salmonella enterica subsp. enterica serovar Agona str. 72.A.52]CCR10390.1 hypothetical protein SA71_2370 [Salmonella enterica subsp. enterica serovar Agona str. 71.E.05]CCR15306.1 hypothetical protein SA70_2687 [Salmonella enterica subsp. enterica serov
MSLVLNLVLWLKFGMNIGALEVKIFRCIITIINQIYH